MKKITSIIIICIAFLTLTSMVNAQATPTPIPTTVNVQNNTENDHTVVIFFIVLGFVLVSGKGVLSRMGKSSYGQSWKNL